MQKTWTIVDQYIEETFALEDDALRQVLENSLDARLEPINVSAAQGKFLQIMTQAIQARRVLEIGTLGGYSTIWMARGLRPDGQLVSLELDPHSAAIAEKNIAAAGLDDLVEIKVGAALATLPRLEGSDPFDLVFIDADKENNAAYFSWALKLSHPGSLIIVDNVIRNGAVVEADSVDAKVLGVRRLNEMMAAESSVDVTQIQTVGSKGYDGFAVARVR